MQTGALLSHDRHLPEMHSKLWLHFSPVERKPFGLAAVWDVILAVLFNVLRWSVIQAGSSMKVSFSSSSVSSPDSGFSREGSP